MGKGAATLGLLVICPAATSALNFYFDTSVQSPMGKPGNAYLDESVTVGRAGARNLNSVDPVAISGAGGVNISLNTEIWNKGGVNAAGGSGGGGGGSSLCLGRGRWCSSSRGGSAVLDGLLLGQEGGGGGGAALARTPQVLKGDDGRLDAGELGILGVVGWEGNGD